MLTAVLPSTTPALAQSGTRAALMIKAPRVADVSQPVAITVSEKHKHQPVAGVGFMH